MDPNNGDEDISHIKDILASHICCDLLGILVVLQFEQVGLAFDPLNDRHFASQRVR